MPGVRPLRRLALVAAGIAVALVAGSCAPSGGRPTLGGAPTANTTAPPAVAPPTTTAPAAPVSTFATAKVPKLGIYDSPVQPEPTRTLDNPQPSGAEPGGTYTLVMLVVEQQRDWLKVLLPVRPNGSSGWIHTADVDLGVTGFRVVVELGKHEITVWDRNDVFLQEPVGVGASGRTPTTIGQFYVIQSLKTIPADYAAYGPHAFALSGFSEVLYSFGNGGTGVLGIHGTSDTSSLGRDVSNGCIRMSNSGILKLAEVLPVGTPVEIKP